MGKSKAKIKFLDGSVREMEVNAQFIRSCQRMNVQNTAGVEVIARRVKIGSDGVFYFKEEKVIEGNIP